MNELKELAIKVNEAFQNAVKEEQCNYHFKIKKIDLRLQELVLDVLIYDFQEFGHNIISLNFNMENLRHELLASKFVDHANLLSLLQNIEIYNTQGSCFKAVRDFYEKYVEIQKDIEKSWKEEQPDFVEILSDFY